MKFIETDLKDVYVIEPDILYDERGRFARTYCKMEFAKINFKKEFVQMNFSFNNKKGTFRGMHYQTAPYEETKLIRCVSGKVFDIAVDLRKNSPTYLQWFGTELSGENSKLVLIPEGVAHGFLTLEDNSELIYHHTNYYYPSAERGVRYDDKSISIKLPGEVLIISDKDKSYKLI